MNNFLEIPHYEPSRFLLLTAILFLAVFLRYLLLSGLYHYLFFSALRGRMRRRFLIAREIPSRQIRQEVGRSALSSAVFALSGSLLVVLWQLGHTRIYVAWTGYPLWYLPLSMLIFLLIHETYYYWVHRWMHRPRIYPLVHKWHHESIHTSALTSFSFHPMESLLQALVVPCLTLFLPINIYVLLFLLLLMTVSATVNHAGVEVYPARFERHWLGRWIIGATHHDLHHKNFRSNYGLYFTFWDKWMGTESPDYDRRFREKTEGGGETEKQSNRLTD